MNKKAHKPTIETIINTAAIALTTFGVNEIMKTNYYGFICLAFAMLMEWIKYFGRAKKLW